MNHGPMGLGRHTQTPLNHTSLFFKPYEKDPFGALRLPLSQEFLKLSLELAAVSYDLDLSPWLNAGWTDVSVQAEKRLFTGMRRVSFNEDRKAFAKSVWTFYRSRLSAKSSDPITQLRSMLRQRKASESGKVLVMSKKDECGKYVIAIGFMGTGARISDWFSNFRMSSLDGFHKGFLQLARQLMANEDKIIFSDIATELGLERLTLKQIIEECRFKDSRFRLWLAGHSQGGAVLQVYAHLKMYEDGVLPYNMVGCGFASPSAAITAFGHTPSAYPIYHVLNRDDMVPQMGSRVHYGMLLNYPSDDALRNTCYTWPKDQVSIQNREKLRCLMRRITDTPTCIESGMAYIEILLSRPVEDIHKALGEMQIKFLPIRQILSIADKRDADVLRFVGKHVDLAYQEMTGHPMDQDKLAAIRGQIEAVISEIGLGAFSAALVQWLTEPHTLVARNSFKMSGYQYIVNRGFAALRASVWTAGQEPHLIWSAMGLVGEVHLEVPALVVRRNPKTLPKNRKRSGGRHRYTHERIRAGRVGRD